MATPKRDSRVRPHVQDPCISVVESSGLLFPYSYTIEEIQRTLQSKVQEKDQVQVGKHVFKKPPAQAFSGTLYYHSHDGIRWEQSSTPCRKGFDNFVMTITWSGNLDYIDREAFLKINIIDTFYLVSQANFTIVIETVCGASTVQTLPLSYRASFGYLPLIGLIVWKNWDWITYLGIEIFSISIGVDVSSTPSSPELPTIPAQSDEQPEMDNGSDITNPGDVIEPESQDVTPVRVRGYWNPSRPSDGYNLDNSNGKRQFKTYYPYDPMLGSDLAKLGYTADPDTLYVPQFLPNGFIVFYPEE